MKAQFLLIPALFLTTSFTRPAENTSSEFRITKKSKTLDIDFVFLRTHQHCKGVLAQWALTDNNGVTGLTLQRTYQNPWDANAAWEDVESFISTPGLYSFTDRPARARTVSYRVIAWMFDGSSIVSDVSRVRLNGHW